VKSPTSLETIVRFEGVDPKGKPVKTTNETINQALAGADEMAVKGVRRPHKK
jgi:hypothetical protein